MLDEVNPTLDDVVRAIVSDRVNLMHTSFAAKVVSYDEATQTATVQPVADRRYRTSDGTEHTARLPQIAKVPILFPSGTGFSITWPLAAGDPVTVVVMERSHAEWKATGNAQTTPGDRRRFDLSDAVAYPGGRSPASPLAGVDATGLVVTATKLLLGSKTASHAFVFGDAIKTLLNGHYHLAPTGVTGPMLDAAGLPAPLDNVAGVAYPHLSTKIKGE